MANDKINAALASDMGDEGNFYFHSSPRLEPFCFQFCVLWLDKPTARLHASHASRLPPPLPPTTPSNDAEDDDNNGIICTVFLCFLCTIYFENVIIFSALGLLAFVLMRRDALAVSLGSCFFSSAFICNASAMSLLLPFQITIPSCESLFLRLLSLIHR